MTDKKYVKDDKILNSNLLLNDVIVIVLVIVFVTVVILVGPGMIFGKIIAQIDFREDFWVSNPCLAHGRKLT